MEVVGLFRDMAVIRMNGSESLVKVGQTSRDGVQLLSADASRAVFTYQGRQYEVGLTNRVSSTFKKVEKPRISINSDGLGQYRIRGAINGRFTNFLVDTGASVVAMSSNDARAAGIEYESGRAGKVQTAQGVTDSYFVTLGSVTIGSITANNVDAAIIDGEFPEDVLLGMSFLSQVQMEEAGGVLTLTARN
jgi:aspartyl protease family protein|tara:strand:+ start:1526 stop:2098 length:573 start_codon:yes stop_codon:yes gene_type:complete